MPFFYCAGIGSHVGQYFEGLSASLLASHISLLVEGNPLMADRAGDETAPPPACLSIRDIRNSYSVTIPDRAAIFFNYMTLAKTPAEIMKEMKQVAEDACERTVGQIRESASRLGLSADVPRPRVVTFEEFASRTDLVRGGGAKAGVREWSDPWTRPWTIVSVHWRSSRRCWGGLPRRGRW